MRSSNTVIKAENVKLLRPDPTPSSAADVPENVGGKEGRQLERKADVRRDSQEEWFRRAEALKKEFYEKGFSEGVEFRKREFLSSLSAMAESVTELKKIKTSFYKDNEKDVLELVLAVARKVIHTEVTTNREVVLTVLREAVKKIGDEKGLKVRLNPDDLRFILEMKNELMQEKQIFKDAVFEGDAAIEKGGVLLETDHLEVDARLDHQFDKIREALKGR